MTWKNHQTVAGRSEGASHTYMGRTRTCSVEIGSKEDQELKKTQKGRPPCILVEDLPPRSVGNHKEGSAWKHAGTRVVCERENSPHQGWPEQYWPYYMSQHGI